MTTPAAGKLQRAVSALAADRAERPEEPLAKAVDRVALRLDLDPSESEWLLRDTARAERERREKK